MAHLNFDLPSLEWLRTQYPATRRPLDIIEHENNRENAEREAHFAQRTVLADAIRTRQKELAERDQRNAGRPVVNDIDDHGLPVKDPGVIDQNGNVIPGRKAWETIGEHDALSHRLPFLRRLETAKQAFDRFDAAPRPSNAWGQAARAVLDYAKSARGPFKPYAGPKGRVMPSSEQLADTGRRAIELRAEQNAVLRCRDDYKTAEAALDAIISAAVAKPPFSLSVPDNLVLGPAGARDRMRVWRHEVDNPELSLAVWLDPEGVRSRLMADLRAQYERDDHLKLSPDERTKRLKAVKAELIEIELAEAWHLLALLEQGELVKPRPNINPRALLQLVPA